MWACFWRELRPLNSTTWADSAKALSRSPLVEGMLDDASHVVLPAFVDDGRARLERLLRIEDGRQLLVFHLDEIEGSFGRIDVDSGHSRDPVADVARFVGEDELVAVLALVGEGGQGLRHHRAREGHLGYVLVGEDGRHTRERLRLRGIDPDHVRVRVGAHEDPADEHAGEHDVGGIDRGARRLAGHIRLG